MCGRVVQRTPIKEMERLFGADAPATNGQPRYNAAPRQKLLILRFNPQEGRRRLDYAEWGLLPNGQSPLLAKRPINARAETIEQIAPFREAFARRRCILPIDGFFEWKAIRGKKQPYAIGMKDGSPFGIAGLWENWRDPQSGEWVRTFCVATVEANALMAKIHDRMPAILHADDYGAWLGETEPGPSKLKGLLVPYEPHAALTMWPVDAKMNNWRVDDPSVLEVCEGEVA